MNKNVLKFLDLFILVTQEGSFSAAARKLKMKQPTLSRQIALLEKELGHRLFNRTTRELSLTKEGKIFLQHAKSVLEKLEEAKDSLNGQIDAGKIRVAVSSVFARKILLPQLSQFMKDHPKLLIEVFSSDSVSALISNDVDLALRFGELQDSSFIVKRLGKMQMGVYAGIDYLKQTGTPKAKNDLKDHQLIGLQFDKTRNNFGFENAQLSVSSMDEVRTAIRENLGIGITPQWFWGSKDKVKRLDLGIQLPDRQISLLFPTKRYIPPRVRLFEEFIRSLLNQL